MNGCECAVSQGKTRPEGWDEDATATAGTSSLSRRCETFDKGEEEVDGRGDTDPYNWHLLATAPGHFSPTLGPTDAVMLCITLAHASSTCITLVTETEDERESWAHTRAGGITCSPGNCR